MKCEAQTEEQMRDTATPWPKTIDDLTEYITSLVKREHDYGTCVYALSLAALAAFNYVSHELGVTGFQASCADLYFLRRNRMLKGPFGIIDGEHALYPQYDLQQQVSDWLVEWRPELAKLAKERLAQSPDAHPAVVARWKDLAAFAQEPNGDTAHD